MNTTKEYRHGTDRKIAAVVGVLFILGTVPAFMRPKVGDVQDDLLVNLYSRLGGDTREALY